MCVYLGKESPPSVISSKNHRLLYLNAIPQHCRSKFEEDEIPDLMILFINVNAAGNVEGEPCGLLKMWILPKKKTAHTSIPSKDFIIHSESLKILNARGSKHFVLLGACISPQNTLLALLSKVPLET
jgi:hypothetical protein